MNTIVIFLVLHQLISINSELSYPKCPCPDPYICFKTPNYVRCSNEVCRSPCTKYPVNNPKWCDCSVPITPAPTSAPTPAPTPAPNSSPTSQMLQMDATVGVEVIGGSITGGGKSNIFDPVYPPLEYSLVGKINFVNGTSGNKYFNVPNFNYPINESGSFIDNSFLSHIALSLIDLLLPTDINILNSTCLISSDNMTVIIEKHPDFYWVDGIANGFNLYCSNSTNGISIYNFSASIRLANEFANNLVETNVFDPPSPTPLPTQPTPPPTPPPSPPPTPCDVTIKTLFLIGMSNDGINVIGSGIDSTTFENIQFFIYNTETQTTTFLANKYPEYCRTFTGPNVQCSIEFISNNDIIVGKYTASMGGLVPFKGDGTNLNNIFGTDGVDTFYGISDSGQVILGVNNQKQIFYTGPDETAILNTDSICPQLISVSNLYLSGDGFLISGTLNCDGTYTNFYYNILSNDIAIADYFGSCSGYTLLKQMSGNGNIIILRCDGYYPYEVNYKSINPASSIDIIVDFTDLVDSIINYYLSYSGDILVVQGANSIAVFTKSTESTTNILNTNGYSIAGILDDGKAYITYEGNPYNLDLYSGVLTPINIGCYTPTMSRVQTKSPKYWFQKFF